MSCQRDAGLEAAQRACRSWGELWWLILLVSEEHGSGFTGHALGINLPAFCLCPTPQRPVEPRPYALRSVRAAMFLWDGQDGRWASGRRSVLPVGEPVELGGGLWQHIFAIFGAVTGVLLCMNVISTHQRG